jgi:hypothetical protein
MEEPRPPAHRFPNSEFVGAQKSGSGSNDRAVDSTQTPTSLAAHSQEMACKHLAHRSRIIGIIYVHMRAHACQQLGSWKRVSRSWAEITWSYVSKYQLPMWPFHSPEWLRLALWILHLHATLWIVDLFCTGYCGVSMLTLRTVVHPAQIRLFTTTFSYTGMISSPTNRYPSLNIPSDNHGTPVLDTMSMLTNE